MNQPDLKARAVKTMGPQAIDELSRDELSEVTAGTSLITAREVLLRAVDALQLRASAAHSAPPLGHPLNFIR